MVGEEQLEEGGGRSLGHRELVYSAVYFRRIISQPERCGI